MEILQFVKLFCGVTILIVSGALLVLDQTQKRWHVLVTWSYPSHILWINEGKKEGIKGQQGFRVRFLFCIRPNIMQRDFDDSSYMLVCWRCRCNSIFPYFIDLSVIWSGGHGQGSSGFGISACKSSRRECRVDQEPGITRWAASGCNWFVVLYL